MIVNLFRRLIDWIRIGILEEGGDEAGRKIGVTTGKIQIFILVIYIYMSYIVNLFGAPWCLGSMVQIEYILNSKEYEIF